MWGNGQSVVGRQQGPLACPVVQRSLPGALSGRRRSRRGAAGRDCQATARGFLSKPFARSPESIDFWTASEPPPPRRFDFVHDPELRPVLEQAYTDSRRALDQGDYDAALRHFLRNPGGHRDRRAGTQGAECAGCRGCARREDCRLVIRDAARRRREGGTHSRRVRPAAGSRADVSRSRQCRRERSEGNSFRARCATGWTGASRGDERSESRPVDPSGMPVRRAVNLPGPGGTPVAMDRGCHR